MLSNIIKVRGGAVHPVASIAMPTETTHFGLYYRCPIIDIISRSLEFKYLRVFIQQNEYREDVGLSLKMTTDPLVKFLKQVLKSKK